MTDSGKDTTHILDHWDARQYLDYYYGPYTEVPADEADMFRFFAEALRAMGRVPTALEIGCGPVLHHAAQTVRWTDRLDMADVQPQNIEEIRMWLRKDPNAFDWTVFLGGKNGVVDVEGDGGTLAEREALMRERIHVMPCDLSKDEPLGRPARYPLVGCYYCAEWVIPNSEGYKFTMKRLASLVEPGGWLMMAGVHDTDFCMINGKPAHCARIVDKELHPLLVELGFSPSTIRIDVTPGLRPEVSGIRGTFMSVAQRMLAD